MRLNRLLAELKRRGVYQVAVAYVVAGFAVLEAADLILPALPAPAWIYRLLVILVLAGFPVVVALAWLFDITPSGVQRDDGPDAEDRAHPDAASRGVPRRLLAGTLVLGLVGIGAWLAGRSASQPPQPDPVAGLAVLPLTPAVSDTGLQRVGREMVVTVSAALTESGLAAADPLAVLASVPPGAGSMTLDEARRVALELGAERFLRGGIVRIGEGVRVDLGLFDTDDLGRLGAETITVDDDGALSDSTTLAALRLLWTDTPPAPPSRGALATGSLAALQAYLDGERAMAEGRWREAPEHFGRAVAADSTFWYAYWRLQLALEYHGSPVDSVVRARVWQHRDELPVRDRLLIEARAAPLPDAIRILQDATERFPSYWPAWWQLAESFVHAGGYLGYTRADARAAVERTLRLNPRFVSAWTHLFWVARADRDTATMRQVIDELSAAHYDRVALQERGINTLAFYRAQLAIVEAPAVPESVIETGVRELSAYRGSRPPENLASSLTQAGLLEAQTALSRAILRQGTALPPMERAQHFARAHAWAGRGDWDSALVAIDAYTAGATDPADLLVGYRLAVVGVLDGALPPDAARARRPERRVTPGDDPDMVAERAWLDGVLALAAADPVGLDRARADLAGSGGAWTGILDRSLAGLARALAGDSVGAATDLVALERESIETSLHSRYGATHPFLNGVHRLTAARWLLAAGDTLSARRLLPWHEVILPAPLFRLQLANQVLATPALRLRQALAETAGRDRQAEEYEMLYRARRGADPNGAEPRRAP